MQGQTGTRGVKATLWVPEVSMQDAMGCGGRTVARRHQEPSGLHCSPRAVITLYITPPSQACFLLPAFSGKLLCCWLL